MVYLQKRDLEKNGFKDFRHFRTRNFTQTPKRLDVLYEVVAYFVKLCTKRVDTLRKTLHDSEMLNFVDRPLLSLALLSTIVTRIVVVYWSSYLR